MHHHPQFTKRVVVAAHYGDFERYQQRQWIQ